MKKNKRISLFEKKLAPFVETQMFIAYLMYKELCEFNGIEFNIDNFLYNYSIIAKEFNQECYKEESIYFHQAVNKVKL